MTMSPTIHATAVLAGRLGVLIRGPSGSGKTRLAYDIIHEPQRFGVPFGCLIADDRVHLSPSHGRLIASAPAALGGLIEIRGIGVQETPFEAEALLDLVVELSSPAAERFPINAPILTKLEGIDLTMIHIPMGQDARIPLREVLLKLGNSQNYPCKFIDNPC